MNRIGRGIVSFCLAWGTGSEHLVKTFSQEVVIPKEETSSSWMGILREEVRGPEVLERSPCPLWVS